MSAFTITITDSVNVLGGGPSSLWNAKNWNAFKWGEGSNPMGKRVTKLSVTSLLPTSSVGGHSAVHMVLSPNLAPSNSTIQKTLAHMVAASPLTFNSSMLSETLVDGKGYDYVFPDHVTNAETRAVMTWSTASSAAVTWTTGIAGSTVWS